MPAVAAAKSPLLSLATTLRATTLGAELTSERPRPRRPCPGPPRRERYRHLQLLGRGGMGEVRLVLDRVLGRTVAMKTLRRDVPTQRRDGDRLLREAVLQARLQHPAIVPVYDVGHDGHGEPYFTMQRIRGRTLASVLGGLWAGEPWAVAHFGPVGRRLEVFRRVCEAVAWAHDHGIVHRDLKPDNVMLGTYGEVWVLDWGVAKVFGADVLGPRDEEAPDLHGSLDMTDDSAIVGTAGYMAPEQVRSGDAAEERSDVYSLGAVLFEVLTLRPLHGGNTVAEVLEATLAGADSRLGGASATGVLPAGLEAVCARATATDPRDRYPDALDLLETVVRVTR